MANIADRTRNRARAEDNAEDQEENAEPEIVLPGDVDGDREELPQREEGEPWMYTP